MGIAVSRGTVPSWLVVLIAGYLPLCTQIVQVGWFYRWGGLPLWVVSKMLYQFLVFFAIMLPSKED